MATPPPSAGAIAPGSTTAATAATLAATSVPPGRTRVKKLKRGIVPATRALPWNTFFPCTHTSTDVLTAATDFEQHLNALPPDGSKEQPLLDFLGVSTQRIALFGYAVGHVIPTHVAREVQLGNMRADFGLLSLPTDRAVAPRLLLVECQAALENSVFEQGNRGLKYWGYDYLDGFSQLADWKCMDYAHVTNQEIATLVQHHSEQMQVSFMLVAGLRKYVLDNISRNRFRWWMDNITLGPNFSVKKFDDIALEAKSNAQNHVNLAVPPVAAATPAAVLALGPAASPASP
jgi:hypothetical protein